MTPVWTKDETEIIIKHQFEPTYKWKFMLNRTERAIQKKAWEIGACLYIREDPKIILDGHVDKNTESGCWLWKGSTNLGGYGTTTFRGQRILAHRLSWEIYNGPIPYHDSYHGMCVLHKCDNRLCVNPDHLFLGTQDDNMKDMKAKNRHGSGKK